MYAVEFQAPIKDGIVYIPKKYQDLQQNKKATIIVMYEKINNENYDDINYMTESSVNTIEDWKDEEEDEIWK